MGELTPITERIDNYLNEYRKRIEQYYKDIEQYYKDHEIYRKTDYELLQILDRTDIDNRELPQTLKEEMLAVEDETVSKYVLDVLNDFTKNEENRALLKESVFGDLLQSKIYLSTQIPLDACIITRATPPMIVVSKGVFFDAKGKRQPIDLLASVLGHELAHKIVYEHTTTAHSQTDEHACDALGVLIANRAGYTPIPFKNHWAQGDKSRFSDRILSSHPSPGLRTSVLSTVIGALELKGYTLSKESNKKYDSSDLRHISSLKKNTVLQDILQSIQYKQASSQEKKEAFIHISKYIFTQRPDLFAQEFFLYQRLFKSFKKSMQDEISHEILQIPILSEFQRDERYKSILFEVFGKTPIVQAERQRRENIHNNLRKLPIETICQQAKEILDYNQKYKKTDSTIGTLLLTDIKDLYEWWRRPKLTDEVILSGNSQTDIIEAIADKERFDLSWKHILDYIDNPENPQENKKALSQMLNLFQLDEKIEFIETTFIQENKKQITDLIIKDRFFPPATNVDQLIKFEKKYLSAHLPLNEETQQPVSLTYPFDFKNKTLAEIVQENKDILTPLFTYNDQECLYMARSHNQADLFLKQLSFLDKQHPDKKPSYAEEFYHKELPDLIVDFFKKEQILTAREQFFQLTKQFTPNIVFSEKSPYIEFLKTSEGKKLPLQDKLSLLSMTPLLKSEKFDLSQGETGLFNFNFFEILNIKEPKTFEELIQLNQEIDKTCSCFQGNDADPYKGDIYLFCKTLTYIKNYINRSFLETLNLDDFKGQYIDLSKMGYCLSDYVEKVPDFVNQTMAKIAEHNFNYLLTDRVNTSAHDDILFMCQEYQKYNSHKSFVERVDERRKHWLRDDKQVSSNYGENINQHMFYFYPASHCLHYYALSDDRYHLNELLEEKIIKNISKNLKTATPQQKKEIYDSCYNVLKNTLSQNPYFKSFLIRTIASLHADRLGLEKDSISQEAFLNTLNPEQYLRDFPMNIADDILCQIMARCETQKEVSFQVRDKIQKVNNETMDTYVQSIREALLYSHRSDLNIDILNFLKQPLTPQGTLKLVHQIETKGAKDIRYTLSSTHPIIEKLLKNQKININSAAVIPSSTKQAAFANLHRNFWSLTSEAQALVMQYLLFNPEETKEINRKNVKDYFKKIKKEINENADFSNYQNLALDTYFENCETEEAQALFIAALYTMNPPAKIPYTGQLTKIPPKRKQRPGEVIKKILSQMGAAGGKTLQAIHSYPGTSEEIRADLKDSKSNFNPPKRYEIFESIENAETFDDGRLKGQTPYVGRLLGSGSFGFTVEVKNEPEAQTGHALTMLHPNALETANNQFKKFFTPISKKLAGKNKKLFGALPSIITQARHLTAIEADFLIGGEQTKVAEAQYGGIQVQSDGYDFQIKAAHIDDFGRRFKKTELASGEHFNDLPTNTNQEQAYKKAVAKAIFTTELYTLLQMGPIDSDRHGAQVRVDGTNITLFDHGAIDFERNEKGKDKNGHTVLGELRPYIPSVSERRQLGKLIAKAFKRSQKGEDFTSALVDVLSKDSQRTTFKDVAGKLFSPFLKNKESRPKLSATMQRALLALGDYIEAMGNTPEERSQAVQECLSSVMQHKEQLDDVLLVSIARGLPKKMLQQLSSPSAQTSSSLQLVDNNPYPKNQTPAFERWILNRFMPRSKQEEQASSLTTRQAEQNKALIKRIREKELTAQAEEKQASKKTSAPSSFLVDRGGR